MHVFKNFLTMKLKAKFSQVAFIATLAAFYTATTAEAQVFKSNAERQANALKVQKLGSSVKPPAGVHNNQKTHSTNQNAQDSGGFFSVPYTENFEDEATFSGFTVHDVSGDGATFKYNSNWKGNFAVCQYGFTDPKDDWLVTPGISLEADRTYRLSFLLWTKGNLKETVEVKMGGGTGIADMTTSVMQPTEITQPGTVDLQQTMEFNVTVPESGTYYFGFHAMTPGDPMDAFDIIIDDIKVEDAALFVAPGKVENLTATAHAKGELMADVCFTTPTKTGGGSDLKALTKAEMYCNGQLAATIDNPGVGTEITKTVPTLQGDNEIMVKVYSTEGAGLESKINVYTGVVRPLEPRNVKARLEDGNIVITWEAPEGGVDGGYIDQSKLTYMVMRSDYNYVDEYATGTSITDTDLGSFTTKPQAIVSYVVYAESAAGLGNGTMSNGVVVGNETYDLPFADSFPDGYPTTDVWGIMSTTETSWFTTTKTAKVTSQDGDNGMIYFSPRGKDESSTIYTGRFCFKGTVNPTLRFYYYYDPELPTGNKVNVQVTKDYDTFTTISTLDFATLDAKPGWNEWRVSLSDFIDEPMVALAFEGVVDENGSNVNLFLDNVRVSDYLDNNLRFYSFNIPGCVRLGEDGAFSTTVENIGNKAASGYTVELYCNDTKVAEKAGEMIQPTGTAVFDFSVAPSYKDAPTGTYQAVINYDKDQNLQDNMSEEGDVAILVPNYPTASSLTGSKGEGGVTNLKWDAPEEASTPIVTNEGFESYEPFIIDGIGDWTVNDADGDYTLSVSYGGSPVDFPNAGMPMAWIVWNGDKAGIGYESTGSTAFCANSGSQCLASFDAAKTGQSNDWLISPELSGEEQTITFFAKTAVPNYGLQEYEVLYSKTGTAPEDFMPIEGTDKEAYFRWQETAVKLPAGARYFAIRNKSQSKLALMVDDIRFTTKDAGTEKLEVTGYNVYRDGLKVNKAPIAETSYSETTDDGQDHSYAVTVVYRQGESGPSNTITVVSTGIEETVNGMVGINVTDKGITLCNADGMKTDVFKTDGTKVWGGTPSAASFHIALPANGMYIVKVGHDLFKVVVGR